MRSLLCAAGVLVRCGACVQAEPNAGAAGFRPQGFEVLPQLPPPVLRDAVMAPPGGGPCIRGRPNPPARQPSWR
jgi:hypothetical protein